MLSNDTTGQYEQKDTFLDGNYIKYNENYLRYTTGNDYSYEESINVDTGNSTLIIKIPVNVYALTYFPKYTPTLSTTITASHTTTETHTTTQGIIYYTPTMTNTQTVSHTITQTTLASYPTPTLSPTITTSATPTPSATPSVTKTTYSYYWAFCYEFDEEVTNGMAVALCFNAYSSQPNIAASSNTLHDPDGYSLLQNGYYPDFYADWYGHSVTVDTNYGVIDSFENARGMSLFVSEVRRSGGNRDDVHDISPWYLSLRDSASYMVYTLDKYTDIPYIRMGFTQSTNYPSKIIFYKSDTPIDPDDVTTWKQGAEKYEISHSGYTSMSNDFTWYYAFNVSSAANPINRQYRYGNIFEYSLANATYVEQYTVPVPTVVLTAYYYAFTLQYDESHTSVSNTLGFNAYSFEPQFNNPNTPEGYYQDDYNLVLLDSNNTIHTQNAINNYYYFEYIRSYNTADRSSIETILDEKTNTFLYTTEAFTNLNSIRIGLATFYTSGGGSSQYREFTDPNRESENANFPTKVIVYKNTVPFNSMSTTQWIQGATGISIDFNNYVNKSGATCYQNYVYRLEQWPNPRTYNVSFTKNFDFNLSDGVEYIPQTSGGGDAQASNLDSLFYSGNSWDAYTHSGIRYAKDIKFQENLPSGSGGNYLYLTDYNYSGITQFELSVPWDISSTITKVHTLNTGGTCWGLAFNNDGSVMYTTVGAYPSNASYIYVYSLSTPWEISTATKTSQHNIYGYFGHYPQKIIYAEYEGVIKIFASNGTTIIEYDSQFQKIQNVDFSAIIATFEISGLQSSGFGGIQINTNGTKINTMHSYSLGNVTGGIIVESALDPPYDLSSATFVASAVFTEVTLLDNFVFKQYDRTKLFILQRISYQNGIANPANVFEYTLDSNIQSAVPLINLNNIQFTGVTLSTTIFAGQSETQPTSIFIKDALTSNETSGERLFIAGLQREKLLEFQLSTPFSIAGSVSDIYSKKIGIQPKSISFDYTGSTFYVLTENNIDVHILTTPWTMESGSTITTISLSYGANNYLNGIDYSNDGTDDYIFIIDSHPTKFTLTRLKLSDSSTQSSVDLRTISNIPNTSYLPIDVHVHRGGEYFLILDKANSQIIQFSFEIPWDVTSNITFMNYYDFSEFHTNAEGFYVNRYDSSSIFIIDSLTDQIYEYIVFDGVISNYYIYLETTNTYTPGNFPVLSNLTDAEKRTLLLSASLNQAYIHNENVSFFFAYLFGREIDNYTYNQVYGAASRGLYEAGGFFTVDSSGIPQEFFPTRGLNYYKLDELIDGTIVNPDSHFGIDSSGNYKILNLQNIALKNKSEDELNSLSLLSTKSFTDAKYIQPKFNITSAIFIPIYVLPISNIVLGTNAGRQVAEIENSVILGTQAGEYASGRQNVNLGNLAGQYSNGINNVYVGTLNGKDLVGSFNVIVGSQSASSLGFSSFSVLIGSFLETPTTDNYLAIGNGSNPLITGNFNDRNLFINGNLFVNGNSKTFVINHPTKNNKYLVHACLEGPENAVFYRGHINIEKQWGLGILPEYFRKLVHHNSVTVQLTPVKSLANVCLWDIDFDKNEFYIKGSEDCKVAYHVFATRKDISDLVFEVDAAIPFKGDGPYTYI